MLNILITMQDLFFRDRAEQSKIIYNAKTETSQKIISREDQKKISKIQNNESV